MKLKVEYLPTDSLVPYANNSKLHPDWQIDQIVESIKQFGNCDPIAIWHNANGEPEIVEGHGRLLALKQLGEERAPTISLDHLDDDARRAYSHVHNKLTMNSQFDQSVVAEEIAELSRFDWSAFGFDFNDDWFNQHERWDTSRKEGNEEYNEFLDKFEPKRTTDDCYTPDNVYEVVADFVSSEYGLEKSAFVRPFYPGGDYQSEKYQDGCVVVDNPPFSIMAEIIRFYTNNGIKFFMFANTLTLFSARDTDTCYIPVGVGITYENGATVNTSFVTNLEDSRLSTKPRLYESLNNANNENLKAMKAEIPNYSYPDQIVTAAMASRFCKYGIEFKIEKNDCVFVSALDSQKEKGKAIYGGGLLLSEKAAAEKAAAEKAAVEKAAVEKWELSERELEIVKGIGA